MTIIELDKETVDKIAAGEVIESPISIIKELVENSVDAGSKNITVEINNGGKTYIRVTDDGCGISRDEIGLAFKKHATSKISNFDDLYVIDSLGFRGEALPSISSVSKVTAISKTEEDEIGSKIEFENNKSKITSIATNRGTSIIVEDLFYNIPARRKFLKSDIAEANKISRLMYAFAIGYKNISFKYIKDNNVQFQSKANYDLKYRVSDLLDSLLEENLLSFEAKNKSYDITGAISQANYYRGNRSMQYIFVNNRLIESDEITRVIESQYQSLIPDARFPAFFIFIFTNPKNIDVNIHPNKKIIKFSYEEELLDLINNSIRNLLGKNKEIKSLHLNETKSEELLDFTDYKAILDKYSPTNMVVRDKDTQYVTSKDDEFFDTNKKLEFDNFIEEELLEETSFVEDINIPTYKTSIFKRYSVFEDKDKLYILDHRKAEEKIQMTKFIKDFNNKNINRQQLLNPIKISLNNLDIEKFESKKEIFERLGFDAELISNTTLVIRELPLIFEIPQNDAFFYEILDIDFDNNDEVIYTDLRKIVKSLSFRKGHSINKYEAEELYKSLMKEEDPYKNYDGKPTIVSIEEKELERYFER